MVDIVSKSKRSEMMSGIRSKNTKPEMLVRKFIFSNGYRFRIHENIEGCKPDLVLRKYKLCIFVNGCYWHQHQGCKLASKPKSNSDFWEKKFKQNIERDNKVKKILLNKGWNIGIIWECSVRDGSFYLMSLSDYFNKSGYWSYPNKLINSKEI